ncbi:hypothetical protein P3S68_011342 [Capsicum galapagoense]
MSRFIWNDLFSVFPHFLVPLSSYNLRCYSSQRPLFIAGTVILIKQMYNIVFNELGDHAIVTARRMLNIMHRRCNLDPEYSRNLRWGNPRISSLRGITRKRNESLSKLCWNLLMGIWVYVRPKCPLAYLVELLLCVHQAMSPVFDDLNGHCEK